jgi:type VI secretion system protein ImpK
MHACLSLGFEGQYRGSPNGSNELQRIRRATYETLRHLKAPADEDISPRWRGLELKMPSLTSRVPVWAIGAAAAAILVGVFFLLRILLGNNTDLIAARLVALHPAEQVTLDRPEFVPAKEVVPDVRDPTQLERIRGVLEAEIAAGDVVVNGVSDQIVVSVNNVLLFDSGKATVKDEFGTLASRIAAALQNEPGPINIIGHTDSVKPSSTARFKSNYDLSVARAQAVSEVMATLIADPTRLTVDGRGELDPIADNSTPEGRAQNRRVEIMIPREETLNL